MVVPIGKRSPGTCELVKLAKLQLSVAVGGVQVAATSQFVGSALTVKLVGQFVITGGVLSEPEITMSFVAVPIEAPQPPVPVQL